jgi:replication-associated recombination protein RarA
MIPILVLSNNPKLIQKYVDKLKAGSHFFTIVPSTKEYSIDDIKNISKETRIFNPKTRIYFLENFHLSSIPAQNSFLKLLEEPPSNVQFVLTTDNKNSLLPTIISRVKIVKLIEKQSSEVDEQFIAPEINGLLKQTRTGVPLSSFKITDKESAKKILLQLINFFRDKIDSDKNAPIILKEILRLNSLLENNNLNPQLTVDQGLIFIWKMYRMN